MCLRCKAAIPIYDGTNTQESGHYILTRDIRVHARCLSPAEKEAMRLGQLVMPW